MAGPLFRCWIGVNVREVINRFWVYDDDYIYCYSGDKSKYSKYVIW